MPESKPYRFHPAAWQEVEAADNWYRDRSAESSVRFLSAVYEGLDQISRWPQRWPRHFHGTRRLILRRFPFFLIYREGLFTIDVIALAHHKRKPRYWNNRV